jgi:hypothetical protein
MASWWLVGGFLKSDVAFDECWLVGGFLESDVAFDECWIGC